MERIVWIFWEGKSYSLLELLKSIIELKSEQGQGYEINFINHDNMHQFIDNIPDCFFNMSYKEQSYYIRTCLIANYGGIYMDLDTLIIENLDSLFDILNDKQCFFIKDENDQLINKLFGAKSDSVLMKNWYKETMDFLSLNANSKKSLEFIGNELLNHVYDNYQNKQNIFLINGPDSLMPISSDNIYDYLKPMNDYTLYERSFQPCLLLNEKIYLQLAKSSCKSIWESNYVLNYFLNQSRKGLIGYNFIEIGTSDFETFIQNANDEVGLSVDALSCYLKRLPDKQNVKKINAAITNNKTSNTIKMYYIKPEIIEKYNLPYWLKGCNTVNDYHPLHYEQKVTHLVTIEEVPLKNVSELMIENKVGGIDYLKTDTEGHDITIIRGFLDWMRLRPKVEWPQKILFESNARSRPEEIQALINDLTNEFGYKLRYSNNDTLVEK